jgi:asparagine synthase (glutamine-hydrolysing)
VLVRQRDLIGLLEDATWHLDEPSGSATALSQLAIAREASKDVAVVLGGDGGDELFGGYERYRLSRLMDLYGRTPSFVRDALRARGSYGKLDTPRGIDRFALFHFTKEHDLQSVLAREFQADYPPQYFKDRFFSNTDVPFLAALMDADRQTLADGSLLRTDKLSMAAGLEARVPILDLEMVQLAARIPADQKVGWFTTKKLFKEAMRDRLPSYLFSEPKRGWFAPSGTWLQQPDFHAYIQEVLSPSYYEETKDLFDWEGIRGVLKGHYEHTRYNRPLIWSLLSFQIWARSFQVTV